VATLGRSTSLRHLDLSHNRITTFPPAGAWPLAPAAAAAAAAAADPRDGPGPGPDEPGPGEEGEGWVGGGAVGGGGRRLLPLAGLLERGWGGSAAEGVMDLGVRGVGPPPLWWWGLECLRLHGNRGLGVLPFDLHVLTAVTEMSYEPAEILIPTQEVGGREREGGLGRVGRVGGRGREGGRELLID
jgi:hypothetical protein